MRNAFCVIVIVAALAACSSPPPPPETPVETAPPALEIADAKYTEIGKQATDMLSKGDIDGYMSNFAENAKLYWSAGDSIIGKPAITAYWKERRGNVIDSLIFSNPAWVPLKVNQPAEGHRGGTWLLGWYFANVKYKNGNKIAMWIHTDLHFDDAGKIDQVVQFLDNAPIKAALAKK